MTLSLALMLGVPFRLVHSQTYEVGGSGAQPAQQKEAAPAPAQNQLGWGSNIQNARLARAAEEALKHENYSEAVNDAQRATEGAPNDPQLWFLLGYAARLARKSQLSISAYEKGLHLSPSSAEGMSGLAQTYALIGRRDDAERLLRQALSVDPRRTSDAALLGEILLQSGQYDQALTVLGQAEQSQPTGRTELLMALCYERLKQFDRADQYLEAAKRRSPNNPEVQRSLAGFYREEGNYPAAITALQSIAHRTPDVTAELAFTYQLAGRPDESAKLYADAADAAAGDLNLQLSAAQAELSAGALERAQRFVDRAAKLDADHYRLHAIRGEIANLEERDQDAVREYTAALAKLPASPAEGPLYSVQLRMDLVAIDRQLGDDDAAHQNLAAAQSAISALDERGPNRPQFLRLRGLIKMDAGDMAGANSDIQEALAINGKDINTLQLDGDLLAKSGHPEDALSAYKKVIAIDPTNRLSLTSLGYVSRENGHDRDAEKYFQKLAAAYPKLYLPYLALGDMYAARQNFAEADAAYQKAFELAPRNSLVVAGAMNAAIEARRIPLAGTWLKRADEHMQQNPYVMREKERYLRFTEDYQQSAAVGEEAIKKLPRDRDVVVYLGYDLLHLERYDELAALTAQYDSVFPKDADIALLSGYVHKHAGQVQEAKQDFTRALERNPQVATAYVNLGFISNDLHEPKAAAADFETALKLEPDNGEAHLGLAYASLNLHRPRVALRQVQLAELKMGDSMPVHLIRATAYGEEGLLNKAAGEYRTALKYSPNESALHLALADTLYSLRQYREAIRELETAQNLDPHDGAIYAQLARCYAQLHDRNNAMLNVRLAEQTTAATDPKNQSTVLVLTGEALNLLGDHAAAMAQFEKALVIPGSDRIEVRLAVANLMVNQDKTDDAHRQIALAFMEAHIGETLPPTPQQFDRAAETFLSMHDFQLAETYFQMASAAGAPETDVHIGLANAYLAVGDTPRAEAQIALIDSSADSEPSYQYLLAKANVLRQQHQNVRALTAFAQAAAAAGEDESAEQELIQAAGNEGLRINDKLSVLSDSSVQGIFEDTTVYPLDAKLDVPNPIPGKRGLLPLPRSSLETQSTEAYHLHLGGLPDLGGFFQIRNERGEISLPSADAIVNRDTTDYNFNFGVNPTLHLGSNVLTFNTGVQETIRRDSLDPYNMNQNLFRQFVYMSTSSFFDMVSMNGYAIREAGPFTENAQRSSDLSAALEFRVGAPWGRTFLVTGWGARKEQFLPINRQFYYTSAYVGVEHRFSPRLNMRAVVEDLRAWRVEINQSAIAQALRPGGSVQYLPARNWSVEVSAAYSRNMSFHAYDAIQSGFAVSYAMPIRRTFRDETGQVELRYPIRFSAGMQQENFFNFPVSSSSTEQFRPYVSITLF
jgi:tetratricopeptide (TPR) repeat protein